MMLFDPTAMATPALPQDPVVIRRIETFIYRVKVDKPVVSTLAILGHRTALLVRVEDSDGTFGWGEVYATMPTYGAEHRALTVHKLLAPLLLGHSFHQPAECWQMLTEKTHNLAIQTGEAGPISAAIGGLDCALWDLLARRAKLPLCSLLGSEPKDLSAYASGLNPADGPQVVAACRAQGFNAFKQKIGFGQNVDLENLRSIRADMAEHEALMVDVNQGWTLEQALDMAPQLTPFNLSWIEEPLAADRPEAEWLACQSAFRAPLAGGENLRAGDFAAQSPWLGVVQPDVGKWGGISAGWAVAQATLAQGLRYCPHWLGSGIGLMASAHLLAAVGGDGLLEIDVNENPLREALCQPFATLAQGKFVLTQSAGIGAEPEQKAAVRWLLQHEETT
ncbi:MAG: mandelate racemase/muconate lactonizing enzyme family protein [Burkholderiaceae bacterium]